MRDKLSRQAIIQNIITDERQKKNSLWHLRCKKAQCGKKKTDKNSLKFKVLDFSEGFYLILVSIVVSIPACHAGDRGSIPRRGDFFSK